MDDIDGYVLITAFWGSITPPEPYDARCDDSGREFWRGHALISKYFEIEKESITKDVPEYWK
ncbi:MAG TPA: hypothetical protein PLV59_02490 [Candidatus Dojkabacteria bacterium]|nr:hypothetical protein [Candidatus Dojkabacteria bacterium]